MDLVKVGIRIKELRLKNNITQEELANKLYISKQAISKWENGYCLHDIDNLEKICCIFNVSIDYILGINKVNQ